MFTPSRSAIRQGRGVRVVRRPLVDDAGRAQRERAVHDVGVPGDPADVGHAPVGVLRVDVLVVLGRPGHVGQVAAGAVLGALGPSRGAAGVHQEQRRLGRHGHRRHDLAAVAGQHVVDEEVAALGHRRLRGILARVAPPDQDLVHVLALLVRLGQRLVRLHLVVGQGAAAPVAVHRDQHPAARVGDPGPAGVAAEAAEDLGVDDAETGAGQHGDRQFRDHRHVQGDPVAGLEPGEVAQQRGELVHPVVQLTVGEGERLLRLRFPHEDQRGLVRVPLQMAVHAVIGRVQPAAGKPLPERRVSGIQDRIPFLVPAEQVRVFGEAVGEVLLVKPVEDRRVVRVGLLDERLERIDVLFLAPVHGNLGLGNLSSLA